MRHEKNVIFPPDDVLFGGMSVRENVQGNWKKFRGLPLGSESKIFDPPSLVMLYLWKCPWSWKSPHKGDFFTTSRYLWSYPKFVYFYSFIFSTYFLLFSQVPSTWEGVMIRRLQVLSPRPKFLLSLNFYIYPGDSSKFLEFILRPDFWEVEGGYADLGYNPGLNFRWGPQRHEIY